MDRLTKMYCTIRVNGEDCPVTNLLDIDGNELGDDDVFGDAYSFVAQLPDGKWLAALVEDANLRPLN